MIVERWLHDGTPVPKALRLNVKRLVLRQNNGTIVGVAADLPGETRAQQLVRFDDPDFQSVLAQLGLRESVSFTTLSGSAGTGKLWTG